MEITVKHLEVVLTKLRLEPGDVLVVSHEPKAFRSREDLEQFRKSMLEAFGVPVAVLPNTIRIEGALHLSPECVEEAARLRSDRLDKMVEQFQVIAKGGA